jgi:hypothetical protein
MDIVSSRIAQAYGYAVCFITVIVMLIGIKQVVDSAFDLSDPIRAENGGYGRTGRPLTSFEVYKLDARRQTEPRPQGTTQAVVPPGKAVSDTTSSDAELRSRYEAERDDVIGNSRFRAIRSLVGNVLLIALAAILFGIHWRWLKGRAAEQPTRSA